MRHIRTNRINLFLFVILLLATTLIALNMPIQAQDGVFATNTPESGAAQETDVEPTEDTTNNTNTGSAPSLFATNTPVGGGSAQSSVTVFNAPQADLFNYGMRAWLEDDFVQLALNQILALEEDEEDAQLAVNLLLYEMEQRFPAAPDSPELRRQFIDAMLNAPVGAVDMRGIMRPLIQATIDANPTESLINANGFVVLLTPANLDGIGEMDRVVNVIYETNGVVRYNEFLLATANDSRSYTLLETTYDLPAAPFGDIISVSTAFLQDVNADTLDELVLRVNDAQASDRFYIIQYRNGRAVDLIDPEVEMRVGEIVNWQIDTPSSVAPVMTVLAYEAQSTYPDWQCLNQITYTWQFERNLYRRSQDLNAQFSNVNSLGCTLANADLFSQPAPEAIATIENALIQYGLEDPSANRALMTLAVLYVLSGRLEDARNTAQSIITIDDNTTWESIQANTLIQATNAPGNTALDICETLATVNEYPACDMNALIGNFLNVVSLSTDQDLIEQLNAVGLPVLESIVVNDVGRAPRNVILFEFVGSGWWGFADSGDGLYIPEPAESPLEFEESIFPQAQIKAPQTAQDALFVDNDPARALAILDNAVRTSGGVPLAPSALYMQALAFEFTGDREGARSNYYNIWDTYTSSVWGQLAAEHLELR